VPRNDLLVRTLEILERTRLEQFLSLSGLLGMLRKLLVQDKLERSFRFVNRDLFYVGDFAQVDGEKGLLRVLVGLDLAFEVAELVLSQLAPL